MNIQLEQGKLKYMTWLKQFDLSDEALQLKTRHIKNVVGFAGRLAILLGLSVEDIALAKFIARHHDDGRFPQWRDYATFTDGKICEDGKKHPHTVLSLEILFKDNMIYKYAPDITDNECEIVRQAITWHGVQNFVGIELTERQILHCKIIRDADMLDNMCNVKQQESIETLMRIQGFKLDEFWSSKITPEVLSTFLSFHSINYGIVKTPADWWLTWIAYLFNLSLNESLQIIAETACVERMFARVAKKFNDNSVNYSFETASVIAMAYIDSKISK